jgi:hypothetical protein
MPPWSKLAPHGSSCLTRKNVAQGGLPVWTRGLEGMRWPKSSAMKQLTSQRPINGPDEGLIS